MRRRRKKYTVANAPRSLRRKWARKAACTRRCKKTKCSPCNRRRSKYSVKTAPASVRRRWARKAAVTRASRRSCSTGFCAPRPAISRSMRSTRYAGVPASSFRDVYDYTGATRPSMSAEEYAGYGYGHRTETPSPAKEAIDFFDKTSKDAMDERGASLRSLHQSRGYSRNPELLIVHNPSGRKRSRARNVGLIVSPRGGSSMRRRRRRSRNSWKGASRRHAAAARKGWRGRRRSRKSSRRRKSSSRRRKCGGRRRVRVGGKNRTWKGLVKKLGVKGAAKIWRKSKKHGGKCKRRRRSKR